MMRDNPDGGCSTCDGDLQPIGEDQELRVWWYRCEDCGEEWNTHEIADARWLASSFSDPDIEDKRGG
jgi:hypothetical protein